MEEKELGFGYLRNDGRKGIRNKVLVVYTVECSRFVCERITEYFHRDRKYDVQCIGNEDCSANQVILRELLQLCAHPNVGAVLAVGMGCESLEARKIATFAEEHGRIANTIIIQKDGGTNNAIQSGIKKVLEMSSILNEDELVPFYSSDLCVGVECGSSDYTSGLIANPLVGRLVDRIIDYGGTAIAEEMTEAIGLKDSLVARGVTEDVKKKISITYDKTIRFCQAVGRFSISPGNFDGGLTTIEEKSMGAVIKTGSKPIEGILKIAQTPPKHGFWFIDTTPDYYIQKSAFHGGDSSSMVPLAAAGCQVLILTTGLGHNAGNIVSPVIKVTANEKTYQRLNGDIDFCASDVLSGRMSMDSALSSLFTLLKKTVSGKYTCSENTGYCIPTLPCNNQHPFLVLDEVNY